MLFFKVLLSHVAIVLLSCALTSFLVFSAASGPFVFRQRLHVSGERVVDSRAQERRAMYIPHRRCYAETAADGHGCGLLLSA